jgi:hypothetical protein
VLHGHCPGCIDSACSHPEKEMSWRGPIAVRSLSPAVLSPGPSTQHPPPPRAPTARRCTHIRLKRGGGGGCECVEGGGASPGAVQCDSRLQFGHCGVGGVEQGARKLSANGARVHIPVGDTRTQTAGTPPTQRRSGGRRRRADGRTHGCWDTRGHKEAKQKATPAYAYRRNATTGLTSGAKGTR